MLAGHAADLWQLDAVAGWQRGRWAVRLEAENLLWSPTPEGQAFFASHWPDDAARSSIPTVQTFYAPGFNLRATVTLDS
jgi:hypothetical protein